MSRVGLFDFFNRATAPEIRGRFPQISAGAAKNIVGARTAGGGFTDFAQLRGIRGLGPSTLSEIERSFLDIADARPQALHLLYFVHSGLGIKIDLPGLLRPALDSIGRGPKIALVFEFVSLPPYDKYSMHDSSQQLRALPKFTAAMADCTELAARFEKSINEEKRAAGWLDAHYKLTPTLRTVLDISDHYVGQGYTIGLFFERYSVQAFFDFGKYRRFRMAAVSAFVKTDFAGAVNLGRSAISHLKAAINERDRLLFTEQVAGLLGRGYTPVVIRGEGHSQGEKYLPTGLIAPERVNISGKAVGIDLFSDFLRYERSGSPLPADEELLILHECLRSFFVDKSSGTEDVNDRLPRTEEWKMMIGHLTRQDYASLRPFLAQRTLETETSRRAAVREWLMNLIISKAEHEPALAEFLQKLCG